MQYFQGRLILWVSIRSPLTDSRCRIMQDANIAHANSNSAIPARTAAMARSMKVSRFLSRK